MAEKILQVASRMVDNIPQVLFTACNKIPRVYFWTYMKNLTFAPEPIIAKQLQELSRITKRPIEDLFNNILETALDQMIEDQDTDYMRLVLDGVVYPDHPQAEAVVENYNAINRATVREHGHFHVRTAWASDDCVVHFTEPALLEV
jgi:hypothetical protein